MFLNSTDLYIINFSQAVCDSETKKSVQSEEEGGEGKVIIV